MSDHNNPVRVVKITAKTAAYIAATGARLWREGTGTILWDPEIENIDITNLDPADEGYINNIDEIDSDTYYWATQLLSFARFVAGIMANADEVSRWEESGEEEYP